MSATDRPRADAQPPAPKAPEGYFLIPRGLAITLTVLAVYIAIALTVLGVGVWKGLGTDSGQEEDLAHLARQTRAVTIQNREALCALRFDLRKRVEQSERFLETHPLGLPRLGVDRGDIEEGIANQGRTIAALSGLDCTP